MSKSVKKCSIHVSFCHFLQPPKLIPTTYLLTTNDNFPENSCLSCQIKTYETNRLGNFGVKMANWGTFGQSGCLITMEQL
jgi:hypothetical protein